MKSGLIKSRTFAAAVMVLLIAVSTWFGAYRSLHGLYNELSDAFYQGVDGDGLSIQNDLEDMMTLSDNLSVVARRNLGADAAAVAELSDARTALSDAKTPAAKYRAAAGLVRAVTAVYSELDPDKLSDSDARYRESLYTDIVSLDRKIGHDGYNHLVDEYNQKISAFPANLLSKLTFVPEGEYYR